MDCLLKGQNMNKYKEEDLRRGGGAFYHSECYTCKATCQHFVLFSAQRHQTTRSVCMNSPIMVSWSHGAVHLQNGAVNCSIQARTTRSQSLKRAPPTQKRRQGVPATRVSSFVLLLFRNRLQISELSLERFLHRRLLQDSFH